MICDWMPNEEPAKKEDHEDEMKRAQEAIARLTNKKKELQEEYQLAKAEKDNHEAEIEEMEAAFETCDCDAKFDEAIAKADEDFAAEGERIEKERAIALEAKEDFEKAVANRISEAAANRDARSEEIATAHAKADEDKEAA